MLDNKTIIVVEPVRWGKEHQSFDASFLLICAEAFPGARIIFCAEQKHIDAVSTDLSGEQAFEYRSISIAKRNSYGFSRLINDWRTAISLRNLMKKERPVNVFLSSVTRELLWSFKILNIRSKGSKIVAVLHAGLFGALQRRRYNLIARFFSLRTAMFLSKEAVRFLVLEKSIHTAVRKKDPQLAELIGVLPLPIPPEFISDHSLKIDQESDLNGLKVGLLGLCTPQKGLFRFLDFARFAANHKDAKIAFEIIGRLHETAVDKAKPYAKYLSRLPSESIIPRDVFTSAIGELHFAFFLFDGDYYDVTASGVLLDCIALGIPVIAEQNHLIQVLEAEAGGAIGITDSKKFNQDELMQRLENLNAQDYYIFRKNIASLRNSRMPQHLADTLLRELSSLSS